MRPDEHKKKRSAQYKKKHDDKVDKPKSTKQTGTQKTPTGPTATVATATHNHNDNDVQKSASIESSGRTDSPSTSAASGGRESEQLDEWEQQKSYRRRQVVSNWERYEGTASLTEDAPTLRGADFKAIVEAGGDAFSQFRFRDEQLWEDGEETEAGSDNTPKCLTIDCDQLAAALLCLPLHERLKVDEAAFLEDQIVLFDELAKTNQAAYEQRQHQVPGKTDPGNGSVSEDTVQSTSPDSSLVIDRHSESSQSEDILDDILRVTDASYMVENVVPDSDDSRDHEKRQTPTDDDNIVKDSAMLSHSAQIQEHNRHRAQGDCRNATTAEPVQKTENIPAATITETVLHNNLAATAETMSQKDNTESSLLKNDVPQKSVSGIEDELDFLLTLEVPISKEEKSTQPTDSCDTGNSDSLDDWLDDMIAS